MAVSWVGAIHADDLKVINLYVVVLLTWVPDLTARTVGG